MSQAGIQTMRQTTARRSADFQRVRGNFRTANQELRSLAAAQQIDAARVGAAMRRRDSARAELEALSTTVILEALPTLAPADRAILARTAAGTAPRRATQAPAAAPKR